MVSTRATLTPSELSGVRVKRVFATIYLDCPDGDDRLRLHCCDCACVCGCDSR